MTGVPTMFLANWRGGARLLRPATSRSSVRSIEIVGSAAWPPLRSASSASSMVAILAAFSALSVSGSAAGRADPRGYVLWSPCSPSLPSRCLHQVPDGCRGNLIVVSDGVPHGYDRHSWPPSQGV